MKQHRLLGMIVFLGLFGALALGCIRDQSRGWAPPIVEDETQIVSTTRGKLDGLDARATPEPAWTGVLSDQIDQTQNSLFASTVSPTDAPYQGDLLRLGSEIIRVRSLTVSGSEREMHLDRGYAGTLAEVHAPGDEIEAYRRSWRFPDDWNVPDQDGLSGVYGDPVLDSGGIVYVGDYNGWVYAFRPGDVRLDARNDDEQPLAASVELGDKVIGGLAFDESLDKLYVTAGNSVYSINAADMRNRLSNRDAPVQRPIVLKTGGDIWTAPTIAGGTVLVASLDGNLYALNGETGAERWRFDAGGGLATTPVVAGDLVLVGGFDSTLFAVSLESGELVWSYETTDWIWGKPAIVDGIAYFGDFDSVFHAVNVETGAVEWSLPLQRGKIRASPALLNGVAVVGTDDGWLIGIDVNQESVVWQRDLGTDVRADLIADGDLVLMAPDDCVTRTSDNAEVYYRAVDPANGDLVAAQGVC